MTRNLSETFKAAVNAQQTEEVFIILLTIDHPDFTDPIRLANDPFQDLPVAGVPGVESRGEEYVYLPFTISLPSQDDTGIGKASLSIDNISRELLAAVKTTTSDVSLIIEVVLSSDVDNVEISSPNFKLERIKYDALTITADVSLDYFELEPYPSGRFTPSDWPGIF